MAFPYMFLQNSINVFVKGKTYNILKSTPEFDKVKEAIKSNVSEDDLLAILDKPVAIVKQNKGNIQVVDGEVYFKNKKVEGPIVSRILFMVDEDIPLDPIDRFLQNLEQNPSFRAVTELYTFLEKCNLPITEDGCFLAYKRVTKDYLDFHTQKIKNTVGTVVSMPRNEVDDNYNNGCSRGLHVAAKEYFNTGFGGESGSHLLAVKVNPKDVVSVPHDCSFTKMRVCEYVVVMEITDYSIPENYAKKKDYTIVEETEDEEFEDKDFCDDEEDDCEDVEENHISKVMDYFNEYLKAKTGKTLSKKESNPIKLYLSSLQYYNYARHLAAKFSITMNDVLDDIEYGEDNFEDMAYNIALFANKTYLDNM